ncbi:MAG: haloalkane dehalogenase [Gemmatimonadales bacterium]
MPSAVLRTPDERFVGLPDFPFEPHYATVGGLRLHFVDEGPRDGRVVLLLHGEPTWSYLYRRMIPPLAAAGFRAVAPDFVGFGRSDKLPRVDDYSYRLHLDTIRGLLDAVGVDRIALFGQDWGGLIGLRLVAAQPERFSSIIVANTALPSASLQMPEAFLRWREYSQRVPEFLAGKIVRKSCLEAIPPEVEAAYDAPFPDQSFTAGARAFPMLVPIDASDPESAENERAWRELERWRKPLLTAFSDGDPITRGGDLVFQRRVPGASGQPHTVIQGAGHFLQEERGEELARVMIAFLKRAG